jgi:FkbM family methyltransferase
LAVQVLFHQQFNRGRIIGGGGSSVGVGVGGEDVVRVQCFPLFTLLAALNVSSVDYLSLDVEGAELDVLKTIPFTLLHIQVSQTSFSA